jgi:hypothetical protein
MIDICLRDDTTIAGNLTFSLFTLAYIRNLSCGTSTYLRPEKSGAIIPRPYFVVLVIIHAPVLWQRITHWENVQMVALALAAFSVATTVVGYWSIALEADQILVWMPLQLLLDNGAMSQLYLLIQAKDRGFGSVSETTRKTHKPWKLLWRHHERLDRLALKKREREKRAFVAVLAFLIFLAMLLLQIFGFIKGLVQHFHAEDLKVPWCSRFLQNYVVAVYDRGIINMQTNCPDFQNPMMDSNKGIGCLNLKAERQMDFLWITVAILPLSMVLEVVEFWQLRRSEAREENPEEENAIRLVAREENAIEDDAREENAIEEDAREEIYDARLWWTVSCLLPSIVAIGSTFQHK